jgi:hypothetical protein
MTETVKISQKEKVTKKYGAMVSYYAELLGLCHQAVAKNSMLSKLDPMGQKTSASYGSKDFSNNFVYQILCKNGQE